MVKDFNFLIDYTSLNKFIGYAIWELNNEQLFYFIIKYIVDLNSLDELIINAELYFPNQQKIQKIKNIKLIINLQECEKNEFVKKIQQSVKIIISQNNLLKDLYIDLLDFFDIIVITKFYSNIISIINQNE